MPRGDKSSYTDKQKRQAAHIEKASRTAACQKPSARVGDGERNHARRKEIRLRRGRVKSRAGTEGGTPLAPRELRQAVAVAAAASFQPGRSKLISSAARRNPCTVGIVRIIRTAQVIIALAIASTRDLRARVDRRCGWHGARLAIAALKLACIALAAYGVYRLARFMFAPCRRRRSRSAAGSRWHRWIRTTPRERTLEPDHGR